MAFSTKEREEGRKEKGKVLRENNNFLWVIYVSSARQAVLQSVGRLLSALAYLPAAVPSTSHLATENFFPPAISLFLLV